MSSLYIVNGTIHTMDSGNTVIDKGAIHIKDGIIYEIGDFPIHLRDGEKILDAGGGHIYPGLVEAHCHIGIQEEKKGMEGNDCNETVNPITPWLRAIDAVNPMDAAFGDAVRAGITCVQVGPGSANVVGGQFLVMKTFGRCIDDMVMKNPSAMKIAFGENPKVNYSGQNQSPVTRMAIAGLLRKELYRARAYYEKKKAFLEERRETEGKGAGAPDKQNRTTGGGQNGTLKITDPVPGFETDFELECWLPVFEGEIPLKAHVHRADDIFTAIRIAKEFGLSMTLDHCSEGHIIAGELGKAGYPVILGPDFASRSKIEVQNAAFKTAGVLEEQNVRMAITTDHPVSLIQALPLCAGMAVKAGLSQEKAFRAITIEAAEIAGVSGRVGSIEVGKDGDIAIFNGNPMEIMTETLYTIIDGKIIYKKEEM